MLRAQPGHGWKQQRIRLTNHASSHDAWLAPKTHRAKNFIRLEVRARRQRPVRPQCLEFETLALGSFTTLATHRVRRFRRDPVSQLNLGKLHALDSEGGGRDLGLNQLERVGFQRCQATGTNGQLELLRVVCIISVDLAAPDLHTGGSVTQKHSDRRVRPDSVNLTGLECLDRGYIPD